MASWKDFIRGFKGEFPTIEEALTDQRISPDKRLIDLHSADVVYDAEGGTVTLPPDFEGGNPFTVLINPQFEDYMERYGENVRYITHHGTPWLSEAERENSGQLADYYRALKRGEKLDLAIINWRKTNPAIKDTGHAALSVGHLNFDDAAYQFTEDDIGPDGNLLPRKQDVDGYESRYSGSYHPSSSGPWIDKHSRKEHMDSMKQRVTGEDPKAHAAGIVTRNALRPAGVAAATALAGGFAAGRSGGTFGSLTAKLAGATTLAYTSGRVTAITQKAPGSVLEKEEKRGHGILATLITPAQRDIMEHMLHGMGKTYFSEYQLWGNNCADFTEHVMKEIGVNTEHLVTRAMEAEPDCKNKAARVAKALTVQSHIRPDRHQWATHTLADDRRIETGELQVDGEDFLVHKLKFTGQSALLIETADEQMFKDKPLKTLSKVLQGGLAINPVNSARGSEFEFRPEAVKISGGQNAGLSR